MSTLLDGRETRKRLVPLVALALVAIAWALASPPIAQDPAYHRFADERTILGIPNFWNVVSNLPFALVGLYGLHACRVGRFGRAEDRWPWVVVAIGSVFVGLGSAYYHLAPSDPTLFWDRLPMTLAFMGLFSVAIVERIAHRAGLFLLLPFVVLGALSVEVWRRGELAGVGDLRFYALVQFYPMLALPLVLLLFPSRYDRAWALWVTLALYVAAKLFEGFDAVVYVVLGHLVSGHAIKHVLAAAAVGVAFHSIARRAPLARRTSLGGSGSATPVTP